MTTLSKNGKRIGRPPKAVVQQPDTAAMLHRALTAFAARYDAAGRGRRFAGWNAPGTGPNAAMEGVQTLRNRTHDSVRNDWASRAANQKWSTTLIGTGIRPRFKRLKGQRLLDMNDLWDDFVRWMDADGVLDGYGMQSLVVKAWVAGGECFARRRPRFLDEGFPVPVQVQLLEADMCPMLDADQYDGLPAGNVIRSGIELNKRGRRIAYWFYKQHPSEKQDVANIAASALIRVAASDVAHIFEPERPGQLRGVSLLAPILARLRNSADFEDATLERQKLANLFTAFIKRTAPSFDPNDPNLDGLTGLAFEDSPEESTPLVPLAPGLMQELDDGQEVQFSDPPDAGANYGDYMRVNNMGTAAGTGMPYEVLSGDIKEVSDRTLRVIINEFRRLAEQRQWQMVIPQYCQRVVDWFADAAVLAGKAAMSELDAIKRVEHSPHGWAHIHPVQDPQGKKLELEMGTISRSSIIAARGDDPATVDAERAADAEREESLGLTPMLQAGTAQQGGNSSTQANQPAQGDGDGIDNEEYTAVPNVSAIHQRQLAKLDAEIGLLESRREAVVAAAAQREQMADRLAEKMANLDLFGED